MSYTSYADVGVHNTMYAKFELTPLVINCFALSVRDDKIGLKLF